jgi:crotonobetainyl-CoA:carnitine CoA-transferase CaiB-like acyl-CoA transferase
MNLLCFTGFAYTWGHPETPMEERAASSTYGDYIAGTMAVASILSALYHREKTGEGQYIEVSQTEAAASLLGIQYLDYFVNQRVPEPAGNRDPRFAPYNCYRCKGDDRWCVITVFNETEWKQFCSALESPKWASDPKFSTLEARLKNVAELDKNIESWTRQKTPHQVMRIMQSWGIAAGAVQNSEDLFFDLQLRNRGHMVELETGARGKLTYDDAPIHLSEGQKTTERAPYLGEHNAYVYHQLLGLTPEEVDKLTQDKVIY